MYTELADGRVKIRGWLLLIAIALWFMPFAAGIVFLSDIFSPHAKQPTTIVEIVDALIQLAASIPLLVLLVRRRKTFVKWINIYQIYSIVEGIIALCVGTFSAGEISTALFSIGITVLWILYFRHSHRVKHTFVR